MQLKVGSKRSYEGYQIDWNWQAVRWRRMWENMGRLSELFVVEMLALYDVQIFYLGSFEKARYKKSYLGIFSSILKSYCLPFLCTY